jgi:hypothetical protein
MIIAAIDPGNVRSALVCWDGSNVLFKAIWPNAEIFNWLVDDDGACSILLIEQVTCYGMPIGKTTLETVFWIGRFYTAGAGCAERHRIARQTIKGHHCGRMSSNDSNIRAAMIAKYEHALQRCKTSAGTVYGLKRDLWAAFALATYWTETENQPRKIWNP